MPTLAELLREGAGQVDATGQLLKGYALTPLAGLGGASRTLVDLLRGEGIDKSVASGARTVEDISNWGPGPFTQRGAERLEGLGGLVEQGTQKVGAALGNPMEKLGSVSPLTAASLTGIANVYNPVKGLKGLKSPKLKPEIHEPLRFDPVEPRQALIPGLEPKTPQQMERELLGRVGQRDVGENPHTTVDAFLNAARNEPSLLTYGTMPENVPRGLDSMVEAFGERAGTRMGVESTGPGDDVPYMIPRKHGYGELMKDERGDYKISEDPKEHSRGDYPMYDEYGDPKMKEVYGPPREGEDFLEDIERRARGGEPKRDEYGNTQYPYRESEGGEFVRDSRGNIVEDENPDYDSSPEGYRISTEKGGHIDVTGYDEARDPDNPAYVHATEASGGGRGQGALMYQALLADASRSGRYIGTDGLTYDNQFRLLNNALANYARTGTNPRDVGQTLSGNRPRARGYASGPEIWEAMTGEADYRVQDRGGDPSRVAFTGTGFTVDGKPVPYDAIKGMIEDLSPHFQRATPSGDQASRVGPKSLMQSAVYKWLERATPEEAEQAVKGWASNVKGPIFGKARPGLLGGIAAGTGGASMVNALRNPREDPQEAERRRMAEMMAAGVGP